MYEYYQMLISYVRVLSIKKILFFIFLLIYVNNLCILRSEMVLIYYFSEQDSQTSRMTNSTV